MSSETGSRPDPYKHLKFVTPPPDWSWVRKYPEYEENPDYSAHLKDGRWIDPTSLEHGDVVFMCTSHNLYGTALRGYMFWKMVSHDGIPYFLFFTLMTNGGKGAVASERMWFRGAFSFKPGKTKAVTPTWENEYRERCDIFLDPLIFSAIRLPDHGALFVKASVDERASEYDLALLGEVIKHSHAYHPQLCQRLRQYVGAPDTAEEAGNGRVVWRTHDFEKFLGSAQGKEDCLRSLCPLHSSMEGAAREWSRIGRRPKKAKRTLTEWNAYKITPPVQLCEFLTGHMGYWKGPL